MDALVALRRHHARWHGKAARVAHRRRARAAGSLHPRARLSNQARIFASDARAQARWVEGMNGAHRMQERAWRARWA